MRLYHKQKKSYVVAKGSFAGVYANLDEIRSVHEMHPDFRISVTQKSMDKGLQAVSTAVTAQQQQQQQISTAPNAPHNKGNSIQVKVDMEAGHSTTTGTGYLPELLPWQEDQTGVPPLGLKRVRSGVSTSELQEDTLGHGVLTKGMLDYTHAKKDLQCRGVVDEDGMAAKHMIL